MSEKMYPIPFASLMNWVVTEYGAVCLRALCVLTLIMALQKHIPPMAASALRYGSTKAKFFLKAKKQLRLLRQRRHNLTCYYRRELNIVNNIEVV